MALKIAAVSGLLAFAVSIFAGVQGQNSFETAVSRALVAMGATFFVGLIIGWMGQRMLEERSGAAQSRPGKSDNLEAKSGPQDR